MKFHCKQTRYGKLSSLNKFPLSPTPPVSPPDSVAHGQVSRVREHPHPVEDELIELGIRFVFYLPILIGPLGSWTLGYF